MTERASPPRSNFDVLFAASTKLTQAATPDALLAAVSDYARHLGASAGVLIYLTGDEKNPVMIGEIVAEWAEDPIKPIGVGTRLNYQEYPEIAAYLSQPEPILFVDDIRKDKRFEGKAWRNLPRLNRKGAAILALDNQGRRIGLLYFAWDKPPKFTARDRKIFLALIQQAAPVIDAMRLLELNRVRAARAERLLQINALLSKATSESEILAAIASYSGAHGAETITLTYFDAATTDRPDLARVVSTWRRRRIDGSTPEIRDPQIVLPATQPIEPILLKKPDRVIFVEDLTNDSRFAPDVRAAMISGTSMRAMIVLPLYSGGRYLGALSILWHEPHVFSEEELYIYTALLQTVPSVVASRRAYLAEEEARHHSELIAAINEGLTAATDEQSILSALGPLTDRFGASLCALAYARADANGNIVEVETVALRSPKRGPLETQDLPVIVFRLKESPFIRMAYEKPYEPIFIEDVAQAGLEGESAPPEALSRRAMIVIPLKTGEQWQGILTCVWDTPQVFTEEMQQLFSSIQPATASVTARRRAYLAQRQRVLEMETVARVSAAATRLLDVKSLLESLTGSMRVSFPDYHIFVFLLDEGSDYFLRMTPMEDGFRIPANYDQSLIVQACRRRRGMIVNDISNAPGFDLAPMVEGAMSEIAVPMVTGERLIGVMDVQSKLVNRFTDSDLLVLGTLADLIAVAIENARLYRRAQELAVLEERNRIARELHDSVSQALYGIGLGARTARALMDRDPSRLKEPLDYILGLTEAGLTEMRALIFELRPESLENEGLVSALGKQAAALQARHRIEVTTELSMEPAVPLATKEALYRIAREALHNVVKHAHATKVEIFLGLAPGGIVLRLADDGVGFNPHGEYPGHLGLKSMRERAARHRGVCDIQSQPGEGTRITILLPFSG